MKEENQKMMEEKYYEFNILSQRIKQIEKQVEAITQQIMEINITSQSLDEISNLNHGAEILIPLSNGIFAKAELKDTKDLLINVGSDTIVKKSIADTIQFISKQAEDLKSAHKQYIVELQSLASRAASIEKELVEMAG